MAVSVRIVNSMVSFGLPITYHFACLFPLQSNFLFSFSIRLSGGIPFSNFDNFIVVGICLMFEQISQTFFINLKAHPNWIFLTAAYMKEWLENVSIYYAERISSVCSCQVTRSSSRTWRKSNITSKRYPQKWICCCLETSPLDCLFLLSLFNVQHVWVRGKCIEAFKNSSVNLWL